MRLTELLAARDDDATTVAIHTDTREVSRAALRDGAHALAAVLRSAGVRTGQAVAVMPGDGADAVAALFGVWLADAVYVPLNPRLTDAEVDRVLAAVRPALVVTDPTRAWRFPGRPVVVAVPEVVRSAYRWLPPDALADPRAPAHDADTALIQFTSGTTGRPKPVLLRHSGISALLEPVLDRLVGRARTRPAEPMPNLIPTSMSLWAGIYNVLFAFRVGAPVILMEHFDTARFTAYVRRFGIRSVVLPPAAMVMLADDPAVADLAPLRYVRSITAPLSPFQARRFRDRFGITVLNCYGQTEIGGEIVGWNAADARAYGEEKLGAVGRPHDGVALRVADADGTELPCGASGELWVRTPALAAGYADGTALAERLGPDGWFRTGDIGRVDAEGFLWIDGRVSDMINRGGLKVFPAEVAEVLRLAPGVADAAVVGMPDPRLGEVPYAFIVPTPGHTADVADLDAWCRTHLAPFKAPARYVTVDALPRNEAGKVLTGELAALGRRQA
ncbi:class I adenylate-forming enzyme family protein [Yinghuangia soli]|uniref:Fatty acid--CoA ligase family protein n=1 Tax=Yinghuangia soli TaxID=2908204 RepID=A0AA41U1B8_9ACTN|nr:fatty acid--CoA ligase family protein [Yinghuangia soli]MCF2525974.1 fatty acid--CoA ligase family protein [Yinghuangia soli]